MTFLQALILGIIQGLTEFLPVSSSGHLELLKALFGDDSLPKESLTFTVVVHFATALSTLIIFRKEVGEICGGLLQFKRNKELVFSVKILISMIPALFVGFFFEKQLESLFSGQVLLVGLMLLLTGLLLFLADKAKKTNRGVSYSNVFIIGLAQAVAVLPGISRSGATISTSVLLGVDRERAARFSFLMVVPLILGKIVKDILDGTVSFESAQIGTLGLGFVGAFFTGLLACKWMIAIVKRSKLTYFAIYCLLVGLVTIGYTLFVA